MSADYRPDIDGLRAVAVLAVVLNHAAPSFLPGGFLGVDIFFVISGYLISRIIFRELEEGSFRFSNFYARRIRRIFPALILVLLAVLAFGTFALFADEYAQLNRHAYWSAAFLENFRLMQESGYFDEAAHTKPLMHLWSLSIEEQFYLLWPLFLVLAWRTSKQGAALFILLLLSALYTFHIAIRDPETLYFQPFARAMELLLGAALAYMQPESAFRRRGWAILLASYSSGEHVLPGRSDRHFLRPLSAPGGRTLSRLDVPDSRCGCSGRLGLSSRFSGESPACRETIGMDRSHQLPALSVALADIFLSAHHGIRYSCSALPVAGHIACVRPGGAHLAFRGIANPPDGGERTSQKKIRPERVVRFHGHALCGLLWCGATGSVFLAGFAATT
jgi:hypothetical protein